MSDLSSILPVLSIGSALLLIIGVYFFGRNSKGRDVERDALKKANKAIVDANKYWNKIDIDTKRKRDLARKWVRNNRKTTESSKAK